MGELTQEVLDGLRDEETSGVIDGEAPGYPRSAMPANERARLANQAASGLPFPCPGCGRSFKYRGDRRNHRRDSHH